MLRVFVDIYVTFLKYSLDQRYQRGAQTPRRIGRPTENFVERETSSSGIRGITALPRKLDDIPR